MTRFFYTLLLLTSSGLWAHDIALGQAVYAGSGCYPGTASIALSPDRTQVAFVFSDYKLDQKGRKSCNIAIPVHVPPSISIAMNTLMFHGSVSLSEGALAGVSIESFFAGTKGPVYQRAWKGSIERGFEIPTRVSLEDSDWSPCGQDVNLRLNTSINLQTAGASQGMISLDSAGTAPGILTLIQWKRC